MRREQPAAHQTDDRANAGTETAGCARPAGKPGDICAGHRIVSGAPSAMRRGVHQRRRKGYEVGAHTFASFPTYNPRKGKSIKCNDLQKIGTDGMAGIPAEVRHQTWLGAARSDAGISAPDHDSSGAGWHFCTGIANLEEDRGGV